MTAAVIAFHALAFAIVVAVLTNAIPARWLDPLLRGLHNTIGITTPTARQLRWVLVVWVLSTVAIFDAMALLLVYVF